LAADGTVFAPRARKPASSCFRPSALILATVVDEGLVIERGPGRRQGQGIDVEGGPDPIEKIGHAGVAQRIADSKPGEPVGLGKGAGHDQIGALVQPGRCIAEFVGLRVLRVGLIDHADHVRRQGSHEILEPVAFQPGPGRVVRVGDKNQARVGPDPLEESSQIVSVGHGMVRGQRRGDPGLCAHHLRRDRIDREGILRKHRLKAGLEEDLSQEDQHVVGTIPQRDAGRIDTVARTQGLLQLEAVGVRIQPEIIELTANRFERFRAGSQGVFVGGQLDRLGDAVFALELGSRLARRIGSEFADAGCGQTLVIQCFH
jgi:hypothetical protein